jgi:hypothetical protein
MRYILTHCTLLLLGIILVISLLSCAGKPAPVLQWSKTFGGRGDDMGHSVQQTTDDGYTICGITKPHGAGLEDVWLIKTNVDGKILWDKTLSGKRFDWGNSVQQTADGGYIISGSIYPEGSNHVLLLKLLQSNGGIS